MEKCGIITVGLRFDFFKDSSFFRFAVDEDAFD